MSEQPKNKPEAINKDESEKRLDVSADASLELSESLPGFLGITVYGSTVRREASPDSDIDIFAFIEEESEMLSGPLTELDGQLTGTYEPALPDKLDIAHKIRQTFAAHEIDNIDLTIAPISDEIMHKQAQQLLLSAEMYDNSDQNNSDAQLSVPRNIRGLFHFDVTNNNALGKYRGDLVSLLAKSPHGETGWQMIRHMVNGFETRSENDTARELPDSLDEAVTTYVLAA